MKARKKDTPAGGRKNYFLETLLFLAVMVLTLRFCFSGQKLYFAQLREMILLVS